MTLFLCAQYSVILLQSGSFVIRYFTTDFRQSIVDSVITSLLLLQFIIAVAACKSERITEY